jgi:hypothetical protein
VNLIWFQCLLLLLLGFIKVFARSSRLTLPCVLLIDLGLSLTTQLLMLLWLSKNLFIIVLLLLISLDHIYYSFILNLNGGFLMMFDSLLLQLVRTNYVSLWTNSLMIFQIWQIRYFQIKLGEVLESLKWNHLCLVNKRWK